MTRALLPRRAAALCAVTLLTLALTAPPALGDEKLPESFALPTDGGTSDESTPDITALAATAQGSVIAADAANHHLIRPARSGSPTVVGGTGVPRDPDDDAEDAYPMLAPRDVAVTDDGTPYTVEDDGAVRFIETGNQPEVFVPAGELSDDGTDLTVAAGPDHLFVGDAAGTLTRVPYDDPESAEELLDYVQPVKKLEFDDVEETLLAVVGSNVNGVTFTSEDEWDTYEAFTSTYSEGTGFVRDVAAAPDGTRYVVGDTGLFVYPADDERIEYPALRGDAVAADDENVWVLDQGIVSELSADTMRESSRDLDLTPHGNPVPATSPGSVSLDSPADVAEYPAAVPLAETTQDVAALSVDEIGRPVIATEGGVFAREPHGGLTERTLDETWDRELSPDTETFTHDDGSMVMLSDGQLSQLDNDGVMTHVPVGFVSDSSTSSLDELDEDAGPQLTHMAADEERLFVSGRSTVYEAHVSGLIDRDSQTPVELPGEIHAMATAGGEDLFVAHHSGGGREVVVSRIDDANRVHESFRVSDLDGPQPDITGMVLGSGGTLFLTDAAGGRIIRGADGDRPRVIASASGDDPDLPPGTPHSPVLDSDGALLFASGTEVHAIPDTTRLGPPVWGVMALATLGVLAGAGGLLWGIRRKLDDAGRTG